LQLPSSERESVNRFFRVSAITAVSKSMAEHACLVNHSRIYLVW